MGNLIRSVVVLIWVHDSFVQICLALSSSTSRFSFPKKDINTDWENNKSTENKSLQYLFPDSIPVSSQDISTFQRQTGQIAPSRAAVSVPSFCRCQHGFPQAFALDPVPPLSTKEKREGKKRRINSSMLKLTCPLLVRALDKMEDNGMIQYYNKILQQQHYENKDSPNNDINLLRKSIQDSHAVHATARINLMKYRPNDPENDDLSYVHKTLGSKGSQAFLDAGVAGVTALDSPLSSTTSIDVKCLHAWLADYLFRGSDQSILGGMVARQLVEAPSLILEHNEGYVGGIVGTPWCHILCDPESKSVPEPPKPRNKQRLKSRKENQRRRRRRQQKSSTISEEKY